MSGERTGFLLRAAACTLLAAAMIGVSELLGEKEIIFPEITALTVGAIAAPKQSWRVSRVRMMLLIAVCSVLGILIVRYIVLCQRRRILSEHIWCAR